MKTVRVASIIIFLFLYSFNGSIHAEITDLKCFFIYKFIGAASYVIVSNIYNEPFSLNFYINKMHKRYMFNLYDIEILRLDEIVDDFGIDKNVKILKLCIDDHLFFDVGVITVFDGEKRGINHCAFDSSLVYKFIEVEDAAEPENDDVYDEEIDYGDKKSLGIGALTSYILLLLDNNTVYNENNIRFIDKANQK